MQKTVLAFGEVLWDLLPNATVLGGAPLNFAYRVNALGDKSRIVSRLGRDRLGEEAMAAILALGLDTSLIQWDDARPTGTVNVCFDEARNPDFTINPDTAYDFIESNDALLAAAAEADCLCFGTLSQRNPQSRETLGRVLDAAKNAVKLLDINLRRNCYWRDTIAASLAAADVLKLNDDEARHLAEMFDLPSGTIERMAELFVRRDHLDCCVVTLGAQGAIAVSAAGEIVRVPGHPVELVDAIGCGDAFTAGFIHAYLAGAPLSESCRLGNALGAAVAAQKGGTNPINPHLLEKFCT